MSAKHEFQSKSRKKWAKKRIRETCCMSEWILVSAERNGKLLKLDRNGKMTVIGQLCIQNIEDCCWLDDSSISTFPWLPVEIGTMWNQVKIHFLDRKKKSSKAAKIKERWKIMLEANFEHHETFTLERLQLCYEIFVWDVLLVAETPENTSKNISLYHRTATIRYISWWDEEKQQFFFIHFSTCWKIGCGWESFSLFSSSSTRRIFTQLYLLSFFSLLSHSRKFVEHHRRVWQLFKWKILSSLHPAIFNLQSRWDLVFLD